MFNKEEVLPLEIVDTLNDVFVKLRRCQSNLPSQGDIVLRQYIGKICYEIDQLLRENESRIIGH